jgi:hypothetical protein
MRSKPLLAGTIALAAAGMVAAVLWAMGTTASGREKFSTVPYMPRDSVFYLAVNTDAASSQWVSLASLLDSVEVAGPLRSAWADLLAEEGLDWEEDIVALLGTEAAVAVTSYEDVMEGAGVIFIAQVRDQDKAEDTILRLIRRSTEDSGTDLLEETYEGVTIHYSEVEESFFGTATSEQGAVAFLDDLVVFGVVRDDVKTAIDVIEGRAPGLDENARFEEARKRQEADFLVWGFVDFGSAWDTFDDFAAEFGVLPGETEDALEEARAQADVVTFAVRAQQYGIVVDTDIVRAPGSDAPAGLPDYSGDFAKRLPESTVLFFGGEAGTSLFADQFDNFRNTDPMFADLLDDFEEELGFALDDGLLNQLSGEIALSFDFTLGGPSPYFGGLFLAEVDDSRTVTENMTKLSQYLDREGVLTASLPDRNGITRLQFDDLSSEAAAWGVMDNTLVAGFPYRAVEEYRARPTRTLADAPAWKRLQELLPDDYNYVGYISLERLLEELETQVDVDLELRAISDGDIGIEALRPIKAIGMTGSTDSRGQSARIVLLIEE